MRCWIVVLALAAVGTAACDDSCTELSNQICKCEKTEARQRSCLSQVESQADAETPTTAEAERCERLLESCNCEALAAGDLAACGLANSPP